MELTVFKESGSEYMNVIKDEAKIALGDGVMPSKYKLLINMALNAARGTTDGVLPPAQNAMKYGATKEEIIETLRVVKYQCGIGGLYTAERALEELFKET